MPACANKPPSGRSYPRETRRSHTAFLALVRYKFTATTVVFQGVRCAPQISELLYDLEVPLSPMLSWYNGQPHSADTLPISQDDPALRVGATVFTTLRIHHHLHHPRSQWSAHCQRLNESLQTLGWASPDWSRVAAGALYLAAHYPVLRVTLFPDGRDWICGRSLPPNLAQWQQTGITAWVASAAAGGGMRSLPALKTGNYLVPWLARQQAQTHGAQEAILTNPQGHWLETSTGSLWGWGQGCYWTPPLGAGILPGLARARLISSLKCQNIEIREDPWSGDCLAQLKAIAYSNCVVDVVPIAQVIGGETRQAYDPHHPQIKRLQAAIATP
jgi:4-amino-4-deoxychorismate lyase